MLFKVMTAIGLLVLAYGAFDAWTTNHPGMGALLTLGAIAVAIPLFMDRRP